MRGNAGNACVRVQIEANGSQKKLVDADSLASVYAAAERGRSEGGEYKSVEIDDQAYVGDAEQTTIL